MVRRAMENGAGRDRPRDARARRPSIAVLDVMMPNLDGLELARALRDDPDFASLPIVLLTARVADADVARGLEAGATDYLSKPFRPQELRERVRTALDGA